MEGYADPFNRGTFPWGREDGDLQYHVRMLSNLRKEYPVLTHGTARYAAVNDAVFLLERRWKDAKVELYVNQSWTEQTVERRRPFLAGSADRNGAHRENADHCTLHCRDALPGGRAENLLAPAGTGEKAKGQGNPVPAVFPAWGNHGTGSL